MKEKRITNIVNSTKFPKQMVLFLITNIYSDVIDYLQSLSVNSLS